MRAGSSPAGRTACDVRTAFLHAVVGILLTFLMQGQLRAEDAVSDGEKFTGVVKIPYLNSPPNSYLKDGKAQGFYIDRQRELALEAGLTFDHILMPVGRIYHETRANTGTITAWIGMPVSKAADTGLKVDPSIFPVLRLNLYSLRGTVLPHLSGLHDTAVVVITGYKYSGLLAELKAKRGVVLLATSKHSTALKMLMAGRAPYLLDYQKYTDAARAERQVQPLPYREIYAKQVHMYVSRRVHGATDLHARLEAASRRILARKNAALLRK